MLRRHLPTALGALLCGPCLTACASQQAPAHLPVPAGLLTCAAEPGSPEASTDAALADWILALREAGADCRGKLAAVAGIVAGR